MYTYVNNRPYTLSYLTVDPRSLVFRPTLKDIYFQRDLLSKKSTCITFCMLLYPFVCLYCLMPV